MLLQLHYAGVLAKQKAIVFGAFTSYQLAEHDHGYNFDEMLAYLRQTIATPILTGLPYGHIEDKVSLMQGANTTLSSHQGSVKLVMRY